MSRPLRLANTGPMVQNEPLASPTARQATSATGDRRHRAPMSSRTESGWRGLGAVVSDTGTSAKPSRTATMANGSKPAGGYRVSMNWPSISTHRLMNV